jgi:hypothetical protein
MITNLTFGVKKSGCGLTNFCSDSVKLELPIPVFGFSKRKLGNMMTSPMYLE